MRFSLLTFLIVVGVAALLLALNLRETSTVSEPSYAPAWGAARHPPPYEMKEMVVSRYSDRGWPIWHTRASNHFAAHNAAAYLQGGSAFIPATPETDYLRAGFDLAIGLLILLATGVASEAVLESLRRRAESRETASILAGANLER